MIFFALCVLSGLAAAQSEPATYGKLSVYSDVAGADIYVDAKFVGQDRATITNIPTGKHYVRVVSGEETIQSGIVRVVEGEETIIVAKPKADRLESRQRRPNYVLFFGGMTDLEYRATISGATTSYDYKPQYGYGAEIEFNISELDLRIDLGFIQNYPAPIAISSSSEVSMAISSPYINISKNILSMTMLKVNIGGGLNHAIFSPGLGTKIWVASQVGYQFFIEAVRSSGETQIYSARLGYATYNGNTDFPSDISAVGLYFRAGVGYQL
jgi:hypothetical protein